MLEEKFKFGIIEKNLGFTKDKDVQGRVNQRSVVIWTQNDLYKTGMVRLTRTKGLFHKWDINLQLNYFNFDKVANDIDLPNLLKHMLEDSTVLEKLNVSIFMTIIGY